MRPEHRPQQVVGVADIRDPVAHRFVDRVLQRPAAGIDADNFRAEQPHAKHVERLAVHVLGAHVDVALEAQQGAGRRGRDTVLPGTGFRDDSPLAHAHREERLPERVVDLVRAGVREVLTLQEDARAPEACREPRGLVERRRPADVVFQQAIELREKERVGARLEIRALERLDRLHQRFRDEASTELAEVAPRVGVAPYGCRARHASTA